LAGGASSFMVASPSATSQETGTHAAGDVGPAPGYPTPRRQRDAERGGGRENADEREAPAPHRPVECPRGVRRGGTQRRQETDVGDQQGVGQSAAALEPHLLALVEPLRLSHAGQRPPHGAAGPRSA
jgi:hypothetical protein